AAPGGVREAAPSDPVPLLRPEAASRAGHGLRVRHLCAVDRADGHPRPLDGGLLDDAARARGAAEAARARPGVAVGRGARARAGLARVARLPGAALRLPRA